MNPLVHGILLGAALVLVVIVGVLLMQEEGAKKYFGYMAIGYVVGVVILAVLAAVGL